MFVKEEDRRMQEREYQQEIYHIIVLFVARMVILYIFVGINLALLLTMGHALEPPHPIVILQFQLLCALRRVLLLFRGPALSLSSGMFLGKVAMVEL